MLHTIIAIILILHGLIHLIGFVVNWKLVTIEDIPYKNSIVAGKIPVGGAGIRVIGVLWLLAAIGFVVAGIGLFVLAPWWLTLTFWMSLFSLALCIAGWPEAQFGVYTNMIILVYLLARESFIWLP